MCFGWVLSADDDERRGDRPARHEDAILEPLAIAAAGLRPTLLHGILGTVLALARAPSLAQSQFLILVEHAIASKRGSTQHSIECLCRSTNLVSELAARRITTL